MLVVRKFIFNLFYENTYVVWDEDKKECIVVDAGCSNSSEEEKISSYINEHGLSIKYLINTHCHIDHILGNNFIKEKYYPEFLIPERDKELLESADTQGAAFGLHVNTQPEADGFLSEEKNIFVGKSEIKFLFTPGHTPGEFCLYFNKEKFCLTGDVLFKNSIGRTDLWNADYDTLINSIKTKLLTLPNETLIYPGHGESSRIEIEKMTNPFLLL